MLFPRESFGMAMALSSAISESVKDLGFGQLKAEQAAAISKFASGKDVFVALPTGYGKSLCYCCLPYVFDRLKSVEKQSIVVVVSPLVALMKDQVAGCSPMGFNAGYVNAEPGNEDMQRGVLGGKCQLVFMSPESLSAFVFGRGIYYYVINDVITLRNHACHPTQLGILQCARPIFPYKIGLDAPG